MALITFVIIPNDVSGKYIPKRIPLNEIKETLNNPIESFYLAMRTNLAANLDNCFAREFNQTLRSRGCEPLVIPNKMCMGQCGSYYIPFKTSESHNLNSIFQDCRSCLPKVFERVGVIMKCPNRKRRLKLKRVILVHSCQCKTEKCVTVTR